jgi:hypothetical protein
MNYRAGNAYDEKSRDTGWFVGFSDWTVDGLSNLLHVPKEQSLSGLCIKWYDHPTGDDSGDKPVSEGRTISILVSGDSEFRIDFCENAGFDAAVETVVLKRHGDFVAWGAGLYHRWHCVDRATVLTVRWQPE